MSGIVIRDYDVRWTETFEKLRQQILTTLGGLIQGVEHVGSTSVPGLPAKPIIDLDVIIANKDKLDSVISGLATLGYSHEGDLGIPGREAFATPAGAPAHHLYVCVQDNAELLRHIAFRDYLRANPEMALEYGELKRILAAKHGTNRGAYAEDKSKFSLGVLELAAKE
ncbi:grpB protein domain-containing protein [Pochonia chlamydosporia 170]|uniref:GrpB protein domain-containing protein n=1 Tax=Pochonia chlamydosporia 170 TaxID=1380566 RepID=A0A179FIT8_METCM|nr:grpB protein domain-containing protein [Pochonia chlamydosporia 170]OAQ64933.1 grpB protein domain-containing protein [Pochonia chlamydosporia 170]